ncbi:hypothetical protein [Sorangium cellulosum]|nr:hypothetical protein [Sorangium cellulosum]
MTARSARRADRERATPASGGMDVVEPLRPGPRPVRRSRILLAHDARATTCDALARAIEDAVANVEIVDASSIDDALLAAATEQFEAFLVCLDLPPAPLGGVRLASELVAHDHPVVLVTRSLRWVPPDRPALHQLPWIPPDAGAPEVADAIGAATGEFDSMIRTRAPRPALLGVPALRARR